MNHWDNDDTRDYIGDGVYVAYDGYNILIRPQSFVHPERYKIAITHRHDKSEECPVDPDDFVIVEQDGSDYLFTDVASEVPWESIIGYSIIDVVPLQEGGDV